MGMEVGNRLIQFIDPQQGELSPRLAKKLEEAVNQPGTDIIIEQGNHKALRMSLKDYLVEQPHFAYFHKAYVVIDTGQGQVAVDLRYLSKSALLEALDKLEKQPQAPLPSGVLGQLESLRQQIIGPPAPTHRDWNLRQAFPDYSQLDDFRERENKWPAASLKDTLSTEAFVDLVNHTEIDGVSTYAVPPSLCQEVFAQLGTGIKTWQELKNALLVHGVPAANLHRLYQQAVVPFIKNFDKLPTELPKVANFQDLSLERSELFQSLWRGGTLESFTDLIAAALTESGEKTLELPPETCKRIFESLGKSINSWEELEGALREVGVDQDRIQSIYRHQVTRFVQQQQIPEDAVLFLANANPRDLSMEAEAALLKKEFGERKVIVVKRPTLEEIAALVQSGRFSRVWVAGHGHPGQTVLTDAQGDAKNVENSLVVKALSSHPAVKMVMGSICFGAFGGEQTSLIGQFAAKGIDAVGYEISVKDGYALEMSKRVAQASKNGKSVTSAATQAYQATEHSSYATGVIRLQPQPSEPRRLQEHTRNLLAQRFYDQAFFPEDPQLQAELQASLKQFPALKPLQELLMALQKRDLQAAGRLLAAHPQLKPVLANPLVRNPILMLQKLPPVLNHPAQPLVSKQKDDYDLPPPTSPEAWESFHADLAKEAAKAFIAPLLARGELPLFNDGHFCPPRTSQNQHALEIGSEISGLLYRELDRSDYFEKQPVPAQLKDILSEYPGLSDVFAYLEALRKNDPGARTRILGQHPELKPLAEGLDAQWAGKGNLRPAELKPFLGFLRSQAIQFFVAQLYLEHKRSFVQAGGNQNLPLD